MALQKLIKVSQTVNNSTFSRYLLPANFANICAEMSQLATDAPKTYTVSTVEVNTQAMDLSAFLAGGGVLVGTGDIT